MKNKVLHLLGSFHQGGSERQAVQLTRLLHESDRYSVHLACLNNSGILRREVDEFHREAIPEYPLNNFYNRNAHKQLSRFCRYLRDNEIDIVQTHDFYTNVFGIVGAAIARVPVRIAARREIGGIRTAKQLLVERSVYRLADVVVANAEAVRRKLVTEGVNTHKIVTIYNGLDLERLTLPQSSRQDILAGFNLSCRRDLRFVTIVANMRYAVKDHRTFLRAARLVHDAVPYTAFVIAGEGELLDQLRALSAELGLQDTVFFIGQCERIGELLSVSDVCVLSSKEEGFPNAVLEYMAAGRPVVATDVGGIREAVGDGEAGYLVGVGDHEAMAARIILMLRNPDLARAMGARGRGIVAEKFSAEVQLKRTEELYETLLGTKRVSRRLRLQKRVADGKATKTYPDSLNP